MERVRLPRGEWLYDPSRQLGGSGGFGAVYEGHSDAHGDLAVKKLHISASNAAHREMTIAGDLAGRTLAHVMPVLDAGEDANCGGYFVVMPRAEKSLQDDLDRGQRFDPFQTASILLEIVEGLREVRDLVHRDIKPANIMSLDGHWKITDFGIARFVEEATSLRTLKDCLSPQYAAPEQWQYIHATSATDVYAAGCVGYALLTGRPPFNGATADELRERHLHANPSDLPGVPAQLRSLLTMMLRKVPESRPSVARVQEILNDFMQRSANAANGPSPASGLDALAEAGAAVARQQAELERQASEARTEGQRRSQLADVGKTVLGEVCNELFSRIRRAAPAATRSGRESLIVLGSGALEIGRDDLTLLHPGLFPRSNWDVILGTKVTVTQRGNNIYSWSSSLWYGKIPGATEYRWYEVSYFGTGSRPGQFAPYDLSNRAEDADLASATTITHIFQVAWGPVPIDDEQLDEFCERWSTLLGEAATGRLRYPSYLPLTRYFWRDRFLS